MAFVLALSVGMLIYVVLLRWGFSKKNEKSIFLTNADKKKFSLDFTVFLTDLVKLIQAGLPLKQALEVAASERVGPVRDAILTPLRYMLLGESPEQAWAKAQDYAYEDDFDSFVMILLLQHEVGGKVAELLTRLIETRRARAQFREKLKALTAEGRLSGVLLAALPLFVCGSLYLLSPNFAQEFLNHASSMPMLFLAAIFWSLGVFFLVKLTRGVAFK